MCHLTTAWTLTLPVLKDGICEVLHSTFPSTEHKWGQLYPPTHGETRIQDGKFLARNKAAFTLDS